MSNEGPRRRHFAVLRSQRCDRDLELIFDHLVATYEALGDPPDEAFQRAASRLRSIEEAMEGLGRTPFRGTLRPDIAPGLRQVTLGRAIFYFRVEEAAQEVRVMAIFFGGQDHLRHMLERIRGS